MVTTGHSEPAMSNPASRRPVPADELAGLLSLAAEGLYPEQSRANSRAMRVRYNALRDATSRFLGFLKTDGITEATLDESLLAGFDASLSKAGVSDLQRRVYRNAVRNLINRLPASHMRRPLQTLAETHRQNRFAGYTPETRDALEHFLREGRKIRRGSTHQQPILAADLLSEVLRKQVVDSTLTFLKQVEADNIFAITEEDVEEYVEYHEEQGRKTTAHKVLDYIRPLFSNLRCRGLLDRDPLRLIPRQKSGINLDYVDQAAIDKLADLSTVNMDDFADVRGRLLSFALDYAYALRNRESSLVRCSDFHGVEVSLPKHIQKVKKDTLPIYSYFPEVTSRLLERYLELRAMKSPATDILVVSMDGKPLGADGCRKAVQDHCIKLGIKTHEGKPIAPHRLRHSFGSLNIEPLGIGLSLVEIKEQLRHASIQMTYDVYITKNPLHRRNGYQKRMEKINGHAALADAKLVMPVVAPPSPVPAQPGDMIDESETIRRLYPLGLNYRSLQFYALQGGKAEKKGRGCLYSSAFVADLAGNYFTRDEAIDLLKMPPSTFHAWTKKEGIGFVLIGKVSLFKKEVIMAKRRAA